MSQPSALLKSYKQLPVSIERGQDVWVWDAEGRKYLDLYAGHAVASTGHCHPRVVKAVQDQAAKLIFYSNVAGSTLREQAARTLLDSAPGFENVFFANSGAEANESALKMARRHTGRSGVVAMLAGFHGRTAGAVSVTGIEKYRQAAAPNVPGVDFVPFGDLAAAEKAVTSATAAILLEPVQSMAGVKVGPPEYYRGLRKLATERGALLIYDEVQTGIGRTGTMFYSGRHGVDADLVTLAKGIASGIPLSAVLVSGPVAAKIGYGEYGATFGAGPVAMAAMKATLETIRDEKLLANVERVGAHLARKLAGVKGVAEVRGVGFLVGLKVGVDAGKLQAKLLERGMIVGTADEPQVIRLLPPLTLKEEHVDAFADILAASIPAL